MTYVLQHRCTCNIESTVCYDHGSICSFSFALHHCPTQSGCGVECQGGGHVSQQSTHYSGGVGSVWEGGHKVKVSTLYSCNIIAVHTPPSGCGTCELDSIISRNEWLNNPLHSNSLSDSAGVSHHLPRADLPHTHTGVQDNSSWMQDSIGMFLALRRNDIAARWENLPPPILCDVMQLDCLVVWPNEIVWLCGSDYEPSALEESTIQVMNIGNMSYGNISTIIIELFFSGRSTCFLYTTQEDPCSF